MKIEIKPIQETVGAALAAHYSPGDLVASGGYTYLVAGGVSIDKPNVFVVMNNTDCGPILLLQSCVALQNPKLVGRLVVSE